MTHLEFPRYLDHIATESRRFRDVLAAADPALPVPSCPRWNTDDLLWHLAEVQHFWAATIQRRPHSPDPETGWGEPERPRTRVDLLAFFDSSSKALQDALAAADPKEPAWTWSEQQTVGFTYRRQAHEALIHRLDAELATGQVTPLDPLLATDGVAEALEVMYGGCPPWGTFTPGERHVRFDVRDTDSQLWVQLGHFAGTSPEGKVYDLADLQVVPDPGTEPDAVVEGTADDLDAWLWHRRPDAPQERVGSV